MAHPRLFNQTTIHNIDWPATPDGDYARRYLTPLLAHGIEKYIANVETELQVLRLDDITLPLTVSRYWPANSYVCSLFNHYFAYGPEEMDKLGNPPLERLLRALLNPIAVLYRRGGFERTVLVNNWLLSTNLYPPLTVEQAQRITLFLAQRFPNRAIVWRSVDERGHSALLAGLRHAGCRAVFSRQVYYQDPRDEALWRKKQLKVDRSLFRRSEYRLVEQADLTAADAPRLAELYRLLYIDKYSHFNPRFTPEFFRLALENNLFTIKAFQKTSSAAGRETQRSPSSKTIQKMSRAAGRGARGVSPQLPLSSKTIQKLGDIAAVMGYYERDGIMTQPIFGYDTAAPQTAGLYRLLSYQVLLDGRAQELLINASGGVGQFKRLRGGQPALEYNVVYDRHLPAHRRAQWALLQRLLNTVAVPIIQKYGF